MATLSRVRTKKNRLASFLALVILGIAGQLYGNALFSEGDHDIESEAKIVPTQIASTKGNIRNDTHPDLVASQRPATSAIGYGGKNRASTTKLDGVNSYRHFENVSILSLRPWEQNTLSFPDRPRKWDLPQHVHSSCAIGSLPKRDIISSKEKCKNVPYERVYQHVQQLFPNDEAETEVHLRCDVCRIVQFLVTHRLTLTLWGDSVQLQVFNGLHCELERRNYLVNTTRKERFGKFKDRLTQAITLQVQVPSVDGSNDEGGVATIHYYGQYKPKTMQRMVQIQSLNTILAQGDAHVVFFNFGLHWNFRWRESYRESMTATLQALFGEMTLDSGNSSGSKIPLLVFRETTAQHFETAMGEYPVGGVKPFTCKQLSDNGTKTWAWKDEMMQSLANETGFSWVVMNPSSTTPPPSPRAQGDPELVVAPFRELSAELYDLHPDECTHFCHLPYFWNPLWRSLRLAMERRFSAASPIL